MDPLANMLTQIRNASLVGQKTCLVRYSKIKEEVLKILKDTGYIGDMKIEEKNGKKNIKVALVYDIDGKSVIRSIRRISKPGRRIYSTYEKIPVVLKGMGLIVLSTSKGIMKDKDARAKKLGGELICEIY